MGGEAAHDQELIGRFQESGDPAELNALFDRHISKIRAAVYPIVLNEADADDVTQETFIRAMKGISAFRGTSGFSTWLYRIAMNTSYSFLRKRNRDPVEVSDTIPERIDTSSMPPDGLNEQAMDETISSALQSLSPRLRAAISLTAIQGMDVREAARIEKCVLATMYWRIHEARRLMKKKLGPHFQHER
jgi:RNA polymerase sigma-70 factor (ECF subfamily)